MKGKILPYKLIGNVVYLMQPWFYSPFKGEKYGFPIQNTLKFYTIQYKDVNGKNFWNVERQIQNFTKRVDIPLHHMLDLVMICICLHMCIVNSDGFDVDWAFEAQRNAQIETNTRFV